MMEDTNSEILDCIVVGAGAAGLTAASVLHDAGKTFVVLEARDRLGGRAHSLPLSDGTPIEQGASRVHGARTPTWDYVIRTGMATHGPKPHELVKLSTAREDGTTHPPYFGGGEWRSGEQSAEVSEALERVPTVLGQPGQEDVSVLDALHQNGFTQAQIDAIAWELDAFAPIPIDELSARSAGDGYALGAENVASFEFVDGYSELWRRIAEPFADRIRLESPVTRVEWSPNGVQVHSAGGQFAARTAVVTLPLGVLQEGSVTFEPSLPQAKQEAIDDLRMGLEIKLGAEFRHAFWEPRVGLVNSFFNADSAMNRWWVPFARRPGPPALIAWTGAIHSAALTGKHEELEEVFISTLQTMFPEVDVRAELVALHIADWPSDPWARGAVSIAPVGAYFKRADLAAPTAPLLWAGEASSIDGNAESVHGAIATGRRAALDAFHLLRPLQPSNPDSRIDWSYFTGLV